MKKLFMLLAFMAFTTACFAQSYKVGNKVEVKWSKDTWYPATIVGVNSTQYKIHLDGDGDDNERDQWVSKDILRSVKVNQKVIAETTKQNGTKVVKGKRVEVNDRAYWYKATVLEQKGDLYKVHFDGYTTADDKWVHRSYIRDLDEGGKAITITCSFAAPPGTFTNTSPASEALFKKEIYDWYNRTVNGTLSRPTQIGIVFTVFTSGQAYKNTVINVPGRGATRRHEGAPVNTTIYPVKTTFFVCEDYNGTVTQKQVNSDWSFFINKEGEWTCSKDN